MFYSRLHEQLASGKTVVTGEIAPPRGASAASLLRIASNVAPAVDALNLTDNQRGLGRMSAMTAAIFLRQQGYEVIAQMTCQHRNRIALQADALGGAACGVTNILAMTGDHPKIGDHPDTKNVLDLNSFQLIKTLRTMRDQATLQSGTTLTEAPKYFVGSVANPNIEKATRLERKIQFGAEFVQTQIIFDVDRFAEWMHDVRALGLHQQAHIMAGIMIIKSANSARFLRDHLPGSRVPEAIVERMQAAADPEAEGIEVAAELSQKLLSIEGVRGIHLMSVGWTKAIPLVVERAGLANR
ncbi:MAG: methylenetetrahydrofolate reductase [Roseiflexaceae bacterium]